MLTTFLYPTLSRSFGGSSAYLESQHPMQSFGLQVSGLPQGFLEARLHLFPWVWCLLFFLFPHGPLVVECMQYPQMDLSHMLLWVLIFSPGQMAPLLGSNEEMLQQPFLKHVTETGMLNMSSLKHKLPLNPKSNQVSISRKA